MTWYRCPTDGRDEDVLGCGALFEQDEPDDEGFVDCTNCGMWFRPRAEDIAHPLMVRRLLHRILVSARA